MTNRAFRFTVIILLLLPLLYVGSYLALVVPEGRVRVRKVDFPAGSTSHQFTHYRIGYELPTSLFSPLAKIDRMARPGAWRNGVFIRGNWVRQPVVAPPAGPGALE